MKPKPKTISLYPLSPEEAVKALFVVKPKKKAKKKPSKKRL